MARACSQPGQAEGKIKPPNDITARSAGQREEPQCAGSASAGASSIPEAMRPRIRACAAIRGIFRGPADRPEVAVPPSSTKEA